MTCHAYHPDMHTNGLQDNCPRCAEHAEHPEWSLDDESLRALIERTQAWMQDEVNPRSMTEGVAMRVVERHLVFVRAAKRVGANL